MSPNSKINSSELTNVMTQMVAEGSFSMVILADQEGFLIASASGPGLDAEKQSASVALVHKIAGQIRNDLGMAQADEISVFAADGQRLVCRPIDIKGNLLMLAVMVPNTQRNYRRLTNKAVHIIQNMWQ